MLKSIKVETRKDLINNMIKKAIIGEISMPNLKPRGKNFLIG